jgi:hypothetical protein
MRRERGKLKIKIQKVSDGMYSAELISSPSDAPSVNPEWTTPAPMHPLDLCNVLLARGLNPTDISDAFEKADPELSPTRHECVPTVGEEALVVNHLGTFIVEEIDADAKTASLRVLRSGILMKDVEWHTIWPLDDKLRARFKNLSNSEEFQQFLSRRSSQNTPGE